MEVLNYTDFRKNLKSVLDKVSNDEEVVIVSRSKNKNVVVISLKEYNSLKETMYLLSTEKNRKRLKESISEMEKGKFYSNSLIEGSSPKTSSPTLALIMASNIPGVGLVTVSERKSISIENIYLQYTPFTPEIC